MAECSTQTESVADAQRTPVLDDEVPVGPRVSLTQVAAQKVLEIRKDESIEANMGLRLRVVGGGCSGFAYDLYFDERQAMDLEFNVHGVQVFVDQMSLMYLDGTEIDYVEGLMGAGFKFGNPNVKSTCGCGSSFEV
jgi:iron-sulfur cluster insertion protein